MPSDETRQRQAAEDMAKSMKSLVSIAERMRENFADFHKMVKADMEAHQWKPVDPKSLKPRYKDGDAVVVYKESHIRDGWRGTIEKLHAETAEVVLTDGYKLHLYGHEMIPLEEKPELGVGTKKFVPDDLGRLHPCEWRANLEMEQISETPPASMEERLMTEEAFRIYNAGVMASKTIANKKNELAEFSEKNTKKFVPDDLGRLYPCEWRDNLGMDKITILKPNDPDLFKYENQMMTEEAFRIYNAGLYACLPGHRGRQGIQRMSKIGDWLKRQDEEMEKFNNPKPAERKRQEETVQPAEEPKKEGK